MAGRRLPLTLATLALSASSAAQNVVTYNPQRPIGIYRYTVTPEPAPGEAARIAPASATAKPAIFELGTERR